MQATWTPSTAQGDSQIVLPVLVLMRKPLPVVVKLRESFRLSSCGISFKPAQHELFVIEPIKEVCEEKGEERDNFCDRGNDKHAAKKQKNLELKNVMNESPGTRISSYQRPAINEQLLTKETLMGERRR